MLKKWKLGLFPVNGVMDRNHVKPTWMTKIHVLFVENVCSKDKNTATHDQSLTYTERIHFFDENIIGVTVIGDYPKKSNAIDNT